MNPEAIASLTIVCSFVCLVSIGGLLLFGTDEGHMLIAFLILLVPFIIFLIFKEQV